METRITATELSRALSDVLNRVRYRGESFLIERNGEPVATLAPAAPPASTTVRDLIDRLGDLTLPGEGFAEELEAIQSSQPMEEASAWRN